MSHAQVDECLDACIRIVELAQKHWLDHQEYMTEYAFSTAHPASNEKKKKFSSSGGPQGTTFVRFVPDSIWDVQTMEGGSQEVSSALSLSD